MLKMQLEIILLMQKVKKRLQLQSDEEVLQMQKRNQSNAFFGQIKSLTGVDGIINSRYVFV